ncbi:MAG: hypothetical protein KKG53_09700 [Proteobacteria bacterium]|nr:hypothetical protein [Pseudomonadota bacterium]
MTQKLFLALTVSGAAWLVSVSALAAINRPSGHEQGNTYEECAVECSEFADAKGCREFRRARLICTEKKKSTWPIFTAQVLHNDE